MSDENSLFRNIGQFFGHVVNAIKHDPTVPTEPSASATVPTEVNRDVQEARQGEFILRRTTIDEVLRAPQVPQDEATSTSKHETDQCQ